MKRMTFIWLVFLAFAPCSFVLSEESECIDLGNRRELFIDDYLVSKMTNVELITHRPERKNLAMIFDKPWEETRKVTLPLCMTVQSIGSIIMLGDRLLITL